MVLSNKEIIKLIEEGLIFIGDNKDAPIDVDQLVFDTTSLNLTLAPKIFSWKRLKGVIIDPSADEFSFKKFAQENTVEESCEDGFIIEPGEFILATTQEYIKLPSSVLARVEGRSSLGRLGISIHVTAPTIHALFEGNITLEIFNHSNFDLKIKAGMSICQLIFENVQGEVEIMNHRSFVKQLNPTG